MQACDKALKQTSATDRHSIKSQTLTDLWRDDIDLVDLQMEGLESGTLVYLLGNGVDVIVSQDKLQGGRGHDLVRQWQAC